MKERYDIFKSDEWAIWKNRLTWCGLYGNAPKPSISIWNFNKETNALDEFRGVTNVDSLYKASKLVAKKYIEWVKNSDDIYTEVEYADMFNFFVGGIGEFFFLYLLSEVKCLYVKENGRLVRYDFNYTAPLLIGEKDFGIDMTGVVNDKNCVIQVKFWNPYSDEILTTDILQKAYAEGVLNEYIDPKQGKNVVICWLGSEDMVSRHLHDNKKLQEHIVFIDKRTLSQSIDGRNTVFWNNLTKKLSCFGLA